MKKYIPDGSVLGSVKRRIGWLFYRLTPGKAWNLLVSGLQLLLKTTKTYSLPVVVKIDISPVCNLRCPSCVHATPGDDPNLQKQDYTGNQRMTIERFTRIIDEIKGRSSAVSLYYLGDPLVHPDLDEMSRIAADAGLGVHISTNFSFRLSDERIRSLLNSGITHFSACVDGLEQEKYAMTRVGGRLELVLDNLKRMCAFKREMGLKYPDIEVQYIKFQHNIDKVPAAEKLLEEMGVDHFTTFWGNLHSYPDLGVDRYEVGKPKAASRVPRCTWPHLNTVIKYNGDVIPCCWFREGEQYIEGGDARVMGNVFETSLKEIWKSPAYDVARAMVSNPEKASKQCGSAADDSFCNGCSMLYDTTRNDNRRLAKDYEFGDLYTLSPKGIPIRRPETVSYKTEEATTVTEKAQEG
jgi:radical SAM protein with 4Fe4S-binding SPASM domain